MADDDIAKQWKSFSPERRTALLQKMTPEQKKKLRSTLEAGQVAPVATPAPETPGFFKRLAQGVGAPSSKQELKAMEPSTAEKVIGPPATAAKLGYNYLSNLYSQGKKTVAEHRAEAEAVKKGEVPFLTGYKATTAADVDFLLKGVLGPIGGQSLSAWGEDISQGNYAGAAGDATAVLVNALLLKGGTKPGTSERVNKLSFATDLPESMNAPEQIKAVLPDLDKAAQGRGAPKTVGELLANVKDAKNAMNTESGLAMQKFKGKQFVPTAISDRIKSRITPNMDMTPQGRQMKQQLLKAAKDYEKPWSYEALDQERMQAGARLRSYYKKAATGKYAELKTDASSIVDHEIVGGVQDIVYPAMDQAAGKPQGYFANLKNRQSTLIQMEEATEDQVKTLSTRQAKIAGSPRLSMENVSAYGHPATSPGISVHRLQNIVVRPKPLAQANAAVARSFSGRPLPKAAIMSLPVRTLLLPPFEQEAEPPKTAGEAKALMAQ